MSLSVCTAEPWIHHTQVTWDLRKGTCWKEDLRDGGQITEIILCLPETPGTLIMVTNYKSYIFSGSISHSFKIGSVARQSYSVMMCGKVK